MYATAVLKQEESSSIHNFKMAPCQRCVCEFCGKALGLFGIDGFGVLRRRHERQCRERQRREASQSGNQGHAVQQAAQPPPETVGNLPTLLGSGVPSLAPQNQIYVENVLERRNEELIRAIFTDYLNQRCTRANIEADVSTSSLPRLPRCSIFALCENHFATTVDLFRLRAAGRRTFMPVELLADHFGEIIELPETGFTTFGSFFSRFFLLELAVDLSFKRNWGGLQDVQLWKFCHGLVFLLRWADVLGQSRPDLMKKLLMAFGPLKYVKDWKVQLAADVLVEKVTQGMEVQVLKHRDLLV